MPVKSICVCDICEKIIINSDSGFIIEGNIYTSNPDSKEPLIGCNIEIDVDSGKIDIKSTYICKNCLVDILKIKSPPVNRL